MRIRKKAIIILFMAVMGMSCYAESAHPFYEHPDSVRQERHDKHHGPRDRKGDVSKKGKLSDYDALLKKGGNVMQGLVTVRHIEGKWYFEVPDSILGRLLLAVTRFTAVPQNFGQLNGEEVTHATVYFEQYDTKTLLMRSYVQSHIADNGSDIAQTLNQSVVDPIVVSFKVIGRNKKKNAQLVEVTSLFRKDNNLVGLSSTNRSTLKLSALQEDRTFIDTMKVYPLNIEVATTRTYNANAGRADASKTGSVTIGLNTSIVLLPKEPMRKRLWDERVGYFVNRFTRFNDDQYRSEHESFISRYRLVPKDVKKYLRGELTEPVQPIVYYIDPATPKKWIPYLIQGVEDWNVAFEAAGFKNAITAKEWSEDLGISLDDARYNVIRYLPSEKENAYGPRIVDPRSGEIIESHICWFHNVTNLLRKWYMIQCGPLDARAQSMKFGDELMGQLVRFASSHEVGHTLGLRHNMGASYATPVEKLRDKAWVERYGHTASIMDYARFNYVAQPEDGISERGLFPRVNDYDQWAIKWGYQYRPEFKDEYEEKEALMKETTEVLRKNSRLWYGGEGKGDDPRAQTEDLGDDPMKASEYGIKNLMRVIQSLPKWTHEENDRYDDLREMYKGVQDQYKTYMNHVLKNIGGRYHNNMPGQMPYENLPQQKQVDALHWLGKYVFTAPLWLYPQEIINKTGTDVVEDLSQRQAFALGVCLRPTILSTIHKNGGLDSYLTTLYQQVWKPLGQKDDLQNQSRRMLEREYLKLLDNILNPTDKGRAGANARTYQSDAVLYVRRHLDRIEQYIKAQQGASTGITALHYQDLQEQINLIRERRTTVK